MAGDDPPVSGHDLDRDWLVDSLVVQPEQGQLNRAIQDGRPRRSNRFVQRVRHPVVEAERAAKDFDLLPVISGEIDPRRLHRRGRDRFARSADRPRGRCHRRWRGAQ